MSCLYRTELDGFLPSHHAFEIPMIGVPEDNGPLGYVPVDSGGNHLSIDLHTFLEYLPRTSCCQQVYRPFAEILHLLRFQPLGVSRLDDGHLVADPFVPAGW